MIPNNGVIPKDIKPSQGIKAKFLEQNKKYQAKMCPICRSPLMDNGKCPNKACGKSHGY